VLINLYLPNQRHQVVWVPAGDVKHHHETLWVIRYNAIYYITEEQAKHWQGQAAHAVVMDNMRRYLQDMERFADHQERMKEITDQHMGIGESSE
jgi:hypothetical protein